MSIEEKITLLEDIMDLDEGELELDAALEDIEEWDSLARLSLMAQIKKLYGKTITVQEIRDFKTVQDICDYLE